MFFFSRPRPLSLVAFALIVTGLSLAHDAPASTASRPSSLVASATGDCSARGFAISPDFTIAC